MNKSPNNEKTYKVFCKKLPKIFFFDKEIAKNHFRRYGKIKRIIFKPKHMACTIDYLNEKSAEDLAKNGYFYNNHKFEVVIEYPKPKVKKTPKDKDPDWVPDPDVLDELEAMKSTSNYNLRLKDEPPTRSNIKPLLDIKPKIAVAKSVPSFSNDHLELIDYVKKSAHTINDKYNVLDARDKLLRYFNKLSQNFDGATKGSCPDMCPEKERLLREIQHQVSIYEQDKNSKSLNPNLAVKQYSRSSADQEASLSHELRPVAVLEMTMSYLINNIMSLCDTNDVNVGEWYHFLWDRTRSIRKDITQQELCCQGSVALVEQCARFHIHCSARLIGEDPSIFDTKINTENLTKCLQTLKYMYSDLALKNETCPNEAEFRAYIILLNLNDANFMWEVQKLQFNIQKSKEVKHALEIYSALNKNNFIRFFKLIKQTSYLNACILMRYFTQARLKAINILLKCYSPKISKPIYPITELTSILAFENDNYTIEFLTMCGLRLNPEQNGIVLDIKMYTEPDFISYGIDRAFNVVESKRCGFTVSQIIFGDKYPGKPIDNYKPQDSFDSDGYLKLKEYFSENQLNQIASSPKPLKKELTDMDFRSSPPRILPTKSLFENVKKESEDKKSIFNFVKTEIKTNNENTNNLWKIEPSKTLNFGVNNSFKFVSPDVVDSKPKVSEKNDIFSKTSNIFEQNKFSFAKSELSKESSIFGTFPSTIQQNISIPNASFKLQEPVKNIPTNQFSFINQTPLPQTNKIENFFFKPFVPPTKTEAIANDQNVVTPPNHDKLKKEQEDLKIKLEQAKKLQEERIAREQKIIEEKERAKRIEEEIKRKEMEKRNREIQEQKRLDLERRQKEELDKKMNEEIKNSVNEVIFNIVEYVVGEILLQKLNELENKMNKRKLNEYFMRWRQFTVRTRRKRKALECSSFWVNSKSPKELAENLTMPHVNENLQNIKKYKLGTPFKIDFNTEPTIKKISFKEISQILTRKYAESGIKFQKNIFWKGVISLPDRDECGYERIENTLSKYLSWTEKNNKTMLLERDNINDVQNITYCIEKRVGFNVDSFDANGIIFIAKKFDSQLGKRILDNIKNYGVYVKLPIALILQEENGDTKNLESLVDQGIISDFLIIYENFKENKLVQAVEKSIKFLIKNTDTPPDIEMDTLCSILIKSMNEIWLNIRSFSKWNSTYKDCLKVPNAAIELYNMAIDKLKLIILDEKSYEFMEFPQIFQECLPSVIPQALPCDYKYFPYFYKDKNYHKILNNLMQDLKLPILKNWPPKDQFDLQKIIFEYCRNVFQIPEKPAYRLLAEFLKTIETNNDFNDINQVFWIDLIEILFEEKMKSLDFSLTPTKFLNKSIFNQTVAVYNPNELKNFTKQNWYYVGNPVVRKYLNVQKNSDLLESSCGKILSIKTLNSMDIDDTLRLAEKEILKSYENKNKYDLSDIYNMTDDLEKSFTVYKEISKRLRDQMHSLV